MSLLIGLLLDIYIVLSELTVFFILFAFRVNEIFGMSWYILFAMIFFSSVISIWFFLIASVSLKGCSVL